MKLVRATCVSAVNLAGAALAGEGVSGAALSPIPVKTSRVDEFTPAADGAWFSWTQASRARPNHYNVFVRRGARPRIKVNASGCEGAGGGIDGETREGS